MLWLVNLSNAPRGEFYFKEGGKTFGPSPLVGSVASDLGSFRKANNLPRSDSQSCLIDVISYTANRLGLSEWTYETDKAPETLLPPSGGGGCSGCGAKI